MATTTTVGQVAQGVITVERSRPQRGEALLGLAFAAPATLILIIFRLIPVIYGFFLSLQGGVAIPEGFVGLRNFIQALGGLAYLLGFVIVILFLQVAYSLFRRGIESADRTRRFYPYMVPGLIASPALLALFVMLFLSDYSYLGWSALILVGAGLLYWFLNLRLGQGRGMQLTLNSLGAALMIITAIALLIFVLNELYTSVQPVLDVMGTLITDRRDRRFAYIVPLLPQFAAWAGVIFFGAAFLLLGRVRSQIDALTHPSQARLFTILRTVTFIISMALLLWIISALDLLRGSVIALGHVTPENLAAATSLPLEDIVSRALLWPHIATIMIGVLLLGCSYFLWQSAQRRATNLGMVSTLLIALLIMIGGWMFVGELPNAAAAGDPDFYASLLRTVTYAAVTVPTQLVIGLLLAYLLFYEVRWGKTFYRIVFFIPYIAPTVGTAAVFAAIFSLKPTSFANSIVTSIGIPAQQWLRDPRGLFEIMAVGGKSTLLPSALPQFLVGPSLPLVSAMLFGVWVFSGYNTVIFLAGLGTVPKEIYEAANVDGAGRWAAFRYITLPLISPTTYFLSLLGIIGTLQALVHIYVLRQADARGAMDTAIVYIYDIIRRATPSRQYAAALSVVLFGLILVMTIIQNRVTQDQVFYG